MKFTSAFGSSTACWPQGKGGALAMKVVGTQGKGGIMATNGSEHTRQRRHLCHEGSGHTSNGGVLAMKVVGTQGKAVS